MALTDPLRPGLGAAARLAPSLAALLCGCITVDLPRSPAVETYALDAPAVAPERAASAAPAPLLIVAAPRAAPGFDGPGMAWVRRPHELRYFARAAWVDAPARLLEPLLVAALARGGFDAVGEGPAVPGARLRLDVELVRLQQEFGEPPSRVRLVLRLLLADVVERRVLGTRDVEVVEPAPSDDPYGGVIAANRAVARALAEVTAWTAAAAAGPGATAR